MRDPALAARLAAFAIDEGAPSLTFANRLARENRWSPDFARRVVAEYLRFVYLAAISPEIVTPSIAVDQAWHLHLCYTRSYWHHLCREVLGRELHHGPTRGGGGERLRYREAYERTLALYRAEFGHAAPGEIWPSAKLRFASDASPVSVTPRDYLLLPKPTLRRAGLAVATVPIAALAAGALATADSGAVVALFFVVGFIVFLVIAIRRSSKDTGDGRHRDSGCGTTSSCGTNSSESSSSDHSGHSHHDAGHSSHDSGGDSDGGGGGDSGCGSGCGGGGCGGGGD